MLIMSCVMIDEKNKLANASSDCLALISKRGDKTTSTTLVVCRSAENKVQLATHLHLAIDNWSKKNLQYSNDDILSLADMLSSAGENENRPLAMPDVNEYVMAIVNQDWSPGPGLTLPRAIDVNRGDTVHLYGGIPKDKTAFVGVKVFAHTLREGTVPAYILDLYDTGAKKGTMNVKHAPAIDLFSTTKSSRTSKKSLLSAMGDA
ncbi:hypothetical protein SARC_07732 [Sphaeroforma arctica JP610]|uniref:Uncharacterized protein n=1 Tax=Sphaeroforma arctica JP610 TaxID=667725 RepID=A0A0L0FVB9_9EUKA|nr:hypothetical protein SARC_07732 [Sphaeroforma arctica JP610]KNC79893.1 hypothetical protein SARC_07732 [Sphaeroforma arctica JP610]|eukprot:XP_014153795.1 hypothetical protein SARC_07732 [Sphaeroforma arctica JP610]